MKRTKLKQPLKEPAKMLKTRDRSETEARLRDAARKVFSEHGFEGSTTRMIADKAGINLSLITRYFKSKYGLLVAVIESDLRDHRDVDALPTQQKSLLEETLAFAEMHFNLLANETDYVRIVIGQFVTDRKFAKKFQEAGLVGSRNELAARLEPHFKKIGVTNKQEIIDFSHDIEKMAISQIVFEMIIKGEPRDESLLKLKQSVRVHCRAYIREEV